jgi:hypothetical protein
VIGKIARLGLQVEMGGSRNRVRCVMIAGKRRNAMNAV